MPEITKPMVDSRRKRFPAGAGWVALAAAVVALGRGLPGDTFFVGDPGVKLIAARNAIAHPGTPLQLPLPTIGGERVVFVEPFFAIHGDHSHAVTSEAFPLVSAPLIALFHIRGAYILPALGFLLSLAACGWIASSLDSRRSAAVAALAAGLGTPLLFYGLEFWEHAPAAGLAALATAAFIRADRDLPGEAFAAGLLFGVTVLLRPEALCYVAAVLGCSRLLPVPARAASLGAATAGLSIAVAPLAAYSLAHFGTVIPPHISAHSALVTEGWLAGRAHVLSVWLVPATPAAAAVCACASIGAVLCWQRHAGGAAPWGRAAVIAAAVATSALIARGTFEIRNFWVVAPAAVVALAWTPADPRREGRAFLVAVALVDIALVVLTAPNDGGGQWGPRYLLFAWVPIAVLASDAIHATARQQAAGVLMVALLCVAGGWTQRTAYRNLRGAKVTYGRVLDLVLSEVPRQGYAVTDLWWLDQVAASATGERQMLFAANAESALDIMRRLDRAGVPSVTVIRSREESPDTGTWSDRTCYAEEGRREIQERALVAIRLRRSCSTPR
jgi:hypothetical protein